MNDSASERRTYVALVFLQIKLSALKLSLQQFFVQRCVKCERSYRIPPELPALSFHRLHWTQSVCTDFSADFSETNLIGAKMRVWESTNRRGFRGGRLMWNGHWVRRDAFSPETSLLRWKVRRDAQDKELFSSGWECCTLIVSVPFQVTRLCWKGSLGNSPAGSWWPSWGPQEPESPH